MATKMDLLLPLQLKVPLSLCVVSSLAMVLKRMFVESDFGDFEASATSVAAGK